MNCHCPISSFDAGNGPGCCRPTLLAVTNVARQDVVLCARFRQCRSTLTAKLESIASSGNGYRRPC